MKNKKAAVFILLGQSNAVGHDLPMSQEDIIEKPLKNVFGLTRSENQSFSNDNLYWSGYTSHSMNLAEEQDNTYSICNCLAALWQNEIDCKKTDDLPDLYIIQIAIGAQGVSEKYMWNPEREEKLIPGKLGVVDISLFPFSMHIFSLLDKSFKDMGKDYEIIGIHWRGGEEDFTEPAEALKKNLDSIYTRIINGFNSVLKNPPIILHKIVCADRTFYFDPSGQQFENMKYINSVFSDKEKEYTNVSVFDVTNAPHYIPDIRCNGIFIDDAVHFTPETNRWVAKCIMNDYINQNKKL